MNHRWDNRNDRDRDERNRGEFSGGPGYLGGDYARDTTRGYGGDYARDGGWSGGGRSDQYARESYRGRGPKNWRRPDERIRETVNELLTDHDGIDATEVEVTVENGEVTLEGMVGSRWEKRIADDIAHSVHGVHDVHNRLRIAAREAQTGKASE